MSIECSRDECSQGVDSVVVVEVGDEDGYGRNLGQRGLRNPQTRTRTPSLTIARRERVVWMQCSRVECIGSVDGGVVGGVGEWVQLRWGQRQLVSHSHSHSDSFNGLQLQCLQCATGKEGSGMD